MSEGRFLASIPIRSRLRLRHQSQENRRQRPAMRTTAPADGNTRITVDYTFDIANIGIGRDEYKELAHTGFP